MIIEVHGYMIFTFLVCRDVPSGSWSCNSLDSRQKQGSRKMNRSQIEKISKALGDETRLRIFEAISRRRQMSCGEIVSMRGVTPATVSHHLKILSKAGLITCRREGQFVYSEPVPETVGEFMRALAKMARSRKSRSH